MGRKFGEHRAPHNVLTLTDEAVANLSPDEKSKFFYDSEMPNLAVRVFRYPGKEGVTHTRSLVYILTQRERRAMRLNGSYITLKVNTVAEARERVVKLSQEVAAALSAAPEDILKPPPKEEMPTYETLMSVLMDAYAQASAGKGVLRHGADRVSFERQHMMRNMDLTGIDFALGQAIKKIAETKNLHRHSERREELLGAIVYLAGAIVWSDMRQNKADGK